MNKDPPVYCDFCLHFDEQAESSKYTSSNNRYPRPLFAEGCVLFTVCLRAPVVVFAML
jgi:hypothetical protein